MSDINIKVNVDTNEAAADADKLKGKLEGVKVDGEKAVKIKVDTTDAKKQTEELQKALTELKKKGLDELSQKSGELAKHFIGGSLGELTDTILKSASAFGPWGQAATAAVGAIGMLYAAYQEYEAEQQRVAAVSEATAQSQRVLGGAYSEIAIAAERGRTAQEAFTLALEASQRILQEQAALTQRGFSASQAQEYAQVLHNLAEEAKQGSGFLRNASEAQIAHALASHNASEQQLILGRSYASTTNHVQEQTIAQRAAAAEEIRIAQQVATTAANVNNFRKQVALDQARYELGAAQAAARNGDMFVEVGGRSISVATGLQIAQDNVARAEREAASASRALASARETEATATSNATQAARQEAELREQEKRKTEADAARERARQASSNAQQAEQNALERRASIEALRLAREEFTTRSYNLSLSEQRERIERRVTTAIEMLADAEARYARSPTTRHRQQLIEQLNNLNQLTSQSTDLQQQAREEDVRSAAELVRKNEQLKTQEQVKRDAATRERERLVEERNQNREKLSIARDYADAVRESEAQVREARQLSAQGSIAGTIRNIVDPNANRREEAIRRQTTAQHALTRASQEYNELLLEQRRTGDQSVAMQQRITAAMTRRTTAQRDSNEATRELETIRLQPITDAMNMMGESATGLAGGLMQTGIAAAIAGENIGESLKKQLAASMTSLAQEAGVRALMELAKGTAALFMNPAEAGTHFAAAGMYGAVAIAAGGVASAVGPGKGETTTADGAATASRMSTPSREQPQKQEAPKNITINLNAFQSNDAAQALIVRSLREAGYGNRAVLGAGVATARR